MNIYLDESGQFTKHNDEEYFVVAAFTVGNPRRTEKAWRAWQRSKFPAKMRDQAEVKFSAGGITDDLRLRTVGKISALDVRIHYGFLKRDNIPHEYWRKETLQSGQLYTNVIGEVLEMYLPTADTEFRVFCDRRHLKGITIPEFKNILKARLLPQLPARSIVQIEMIDSTSNANIQVVDWIAGALARYLEKKNLGNMFFTLLSNNILKQEGKELFG